MLQINKIYNMDVLDFLKNIDINEEFKGFDLIIADPPYYKKVNEKWDRQWKTIEDYLQWSEKWFKECARLLKSTGSLFVYNYFDMLALQKPIFDKYLYFEIELHWYRSSRGKARTFQQNCEMLMYYVKDPKNFKFYQQKERKYRTGKWLGKKAQYKNTKWFKDEFGLWYRLGIQGNVIEVPSVQVGQKEFCKHPTQKPLALCDILIKSTTDENDLIFIPFAGSGNEIESAIRNNRKWIACEKENEYIINYINPRINKYNNKI